jgi:multidrug efflux pump
MRLTEICIDRPVLAWMLMAATVVFGGIATSRMGISQYPDADYPQLSVSLSWPGAAAQMMESDVLEPVETAMAQVEGVRNLYASAAEGSASLRLELDPARNVDAALQDVQSRLARAVRYLPSDVEPPTVSKSNKEDQPILYVGLSGNLSPQRLADLARLFVRDRLQTLEGVGEISLGGSVERNVRIWIDANRLNAHNLTVLEVMAALRREHIERPAGRLEAADTEVSVRVVGEAVTLAALRLLVVAQPDGTPVRLQDVAYVEDGFEDRRHLARVNGHAAQGLAIRKQRGANAVAVAKRVRQALGALQQELPDGAQVGVNFDSTVFIEESVHEIEFEIALAIVLTGLICWAFLGTLSSTLNVVLAIPMSLLGTTGVLYFLGYTLNTFTLLALGLAVGIVVDDAIMVMENIYRHHEAGAAPREAARLGTQEIAFAAFAATLAVVAIFAPVIFMRGIIGRYFLQFGVALTVAVGLSYLEAMTLAPARCAVLLQRASRQTARPMLQPTAQSMPQSMPQSTAQQVGHPAGRVHRTVNRGLHRLTAAYGRVLGTALRHPFKIVLGGLGLFALSLFALHRLPGEFSPAQDQSRLLVFLDTAVGTNLQNMDRLVRRAEGIVLAQPEIARDMTVVGSGEVNSAFMYLTLVPPQQRQVSQAQMATRLRHDLRQIAGLRVQVQDLSQPSFGAQSGFPVAFSLRGPDWSTLIAQSEQIKAQLQRSGLMVDVSDDHQVDMAQLRITPRRAEAARAGVSAQDIATTLEALIGGSRVGKFSHEGRRLDIRLRLLAQQRQRPEDLAQLFVRSATGTLVPLRSLVDTEEVPVMQSVSRINRERAISFRANLAPNTAQSVALAHVQALKDTLPPGYHVVLEGSSATFADSLQDLKFAGLLGIGVAYMILAAQFNSFLQPLSVLSILPLSLAGAFFALSACGQSLNIFSIIGLLLLLGIVKKNSILLVDYATVQRATGVAAGEAMLRAGQARLRPILMTSAATAMAVLPSAASLGPGSETRGPMGVAVLGGLVVSTLLSLLVVPACYLLIDRLQSRAARSPTAGSAA